MSMQLPIPSYMYCHTAILPYCHTAMLPYCHVTYHDIHILQFIEQHELDSDQSVIVGPHVTHVEVELTGDTAQLCELVLTWNEPPRVSRQGAMPFEVVQPATKQIVAREST